MPWCGSWSAPPGSLGTVAARAGARGGRAIPLLVRTLALRTILLVTAWVAAEAREVPLAAHQVTATIWGLLTFALDALAIAGQALTEALGPVTSAPHRRRRR